MKSAAVKKPDARYIGEKAMTVAFQAGVFGAWSLALSETRRAGAAFVTAALAFAIGLGCIVIEIVAEAR